MPKARVLDEYKDAYCAEIEKYFADRMDCVSVREDTCGRPFGVVTKSPSLVKWAASRNFSMKTIAQWREEHPAFSAACDRAETKERAILEEMGEAGCAPKYVEMRFKVLGLLKEEERRGEMPTIQVNIDPKSLKYADVKDIDEAKIVAMIADVQEQEKQEAISNDNDAGAGQHGEEAGSGECDGCDAAGVSEARGG
jgi:hypothetical protein